MGELYAYIRVSTQEQHPDRQIEGIKKHFPTISDENLFIEKISGKKGMDERQEYAVLRRVLRTGDELVIDSLDRLGRRKADIKAELEYLKNRGIILRVILIPTTLIEIDGQAWAIEMINNLLIPKASMYKRNKGIRHHRYATKNMLLYYQIFVEALDLYKPLCYQHEIFQVCLIMDIIEMEL